MSSDSAPSPPNERLEVPALPPPSSRFVLPPPPSDLLSRLQAFLPQIRDANARLEEENADLDGDHREEAVVMEEFSSSSDSDDSSSDESSDDDRSDEEASSRTEGEAQVERMQEDAQAEGGTMAHLLDISSRSKVMRNKVLVVEEPSAEDQAAVEES
ncbi:hypothetical protein JCM1841_002399 [Sporobolomyces salmonicolor]